MQNVYGYVYMSVFCETGLSERGAKIAASRVGSKIVGYRSPINNMFIKTAVKNDAGKWEAK
ncbi:hypothetical protein [Vibrio alginolyticus]|uniref:hypothetical protein n=1 Tax=Vibrio alginolyticus TaxID=663 RepID=UPI001C3C546B|nr:hypothetical protein [Vibrio alginolyticus]